MYASPVIRDLKDVERLIRENNPLELLHVPIFLSFNPGFVEKFGKDQDWIEKICMQLSNHENYQVRSNALLGFSHIARNYGCIKNSCIFDIVKSAFNDTNEHVRRRSLLVAEDFQDFLSISIV
jgi:hypothetical protein